MGARTCRTAYSRRTWPGIPSLDPATSVSALLMNPVRRPWNGSFCSSLQVLKMSSTFLFIFELLGQRESGPLLLLGVDILALLQVPRLGNWQLSLSSACPHVELFDAEFGKITSNIP